VQKHLPLRPAQQNIEPLIDKTLKPIIAQTPENEVAHLFEQRDLILNACVKTTEMFICEKIFNNFC
jgi:hypothetical protein